MDPRHILGRRGEQIAGRILEAHGYTGLRYNVRTRCGEVDIVAMDGDTLVAVEVKTRSRAGFAHIHRALTRYRLERLARALVYLQWETQHINYLRVDALLLCLDGDTLVRARLLKNVYRQE